MKRSALTRRTPLKRTAMKRRPAKVLAGDTRAAIEAWKAEHLACACCWIPTWRTWGGLEAHHIWGQARKRRMDFIYNLLSLCRPCHERIGHGRDNRGLCLYLKRESDIENFRPDLMQEALTRFGTERLPDVPSELPAFVLELRKDWTR